MGLRDAGDPVELAERYEHEGADELVFLDISATLEKRKTLFDLVERIAKVLTIPFSVGGGISSIEEIQVLLKAGADKVSLNSSIVKEPAFITKASEKFGSQCIIAAVDVKHQEDDWFVYIKGGTEATGLRALDWIQECEQLGAGEILLTSMDRDGTRNGFDLPLLHTVSGMCTLPLIASGGAGTITHCIDAFTKGKADAVLAASIFHFREIEIRELKKRLHESGIPVRTG